MGSTRTHHVGFGAKDLPTRKVNKLCLVRCVVFVLEVEIDGLRVQNMQLSKIQTAGAVHVNCWAVDVGFGENDIEALGV